MQYYWHVITSREGWETLTKQDVNYPTSYPVLAGCVQLSETEFVVCPLPVADIADLLATADTAVHANFTPKRPTTNTLVIPDEVVTLDAAIQANIAANADVTLQLPDEETFQRVWQELDLDNPKFDDDYVAGDTK